MVFLRMGQMHDSSLVVFRLGFSEVDSEFVKRCIKAIGKIAIRYEKSVEKCMAILSKMIKDTRDIASHAEHVVNEILVVKLYIYLDSQKYSQKVSIKV